VESTSEGLLAISTQQESAAQLGSGEGGVQIWLPASDCIRSQVGKVNSQHWWVATQDKALREVLEQVPGAPIIYATVNGIHLDTPSEMAKKTGRDAELVSSSLPSHERKSEALKDLELIRPKLTTSVKYRRNKAKGPNPLASKKKSEKGCTSLSSKTYGP
jgi:U3 small nucleolar RNA-associated protein 23